MKRSEYIIGIGIAIVIALIAYFITQAWALGPIPPRDLRGLARFYLYSMMNEKSPFCVSSPEAVTSILWDYRGLDTLYETAVFFLAIIGAVTVFRLLREHEKKVEEHRKEIKEPGMTLIVRLITKLTFAIIMVVAASIALHGQITPGGGFQGGAALAVAPLLAIAGLSRYFVEDVGLKEKTALALRTLGLTIIGLIALIPLILMSLGGLAYFMQNLPKPWAKYIGFPKWLLGVPLGGSLFFYNIAECLAVGAGFTVVFLLLSIPEDIFKKIIKGEKGE